jgi:hypothetical protein
MAGRLAEEVDHLVKEQGVQFTIGGSRQRPSATRGLVELPRNIPRRGNDLGNPGLQGAPGHAVVLGVLRVLD